MRTVLAIVVMSVVTAGCAVVFGLILHGAAVWIENRRRHEAIRAVATHDPHASPHGDVPRVIAIAEDAPATGTIMPDAASKRRAAAIRGRR